MRRVSPSLYCMCALDCLLLDFLGLLLCCSSILSLLSLSLSIYSLIPSPPLPILLFSSILLLSPLLSLSFSPPFLSPFIPFPFLSFLPLPLLSSPTSSLLSPSSLLPSLSSLLFSSPPLPSTPYLSSCPSEW